MSVEISHDLHTTDMGYLNYHFDDKLFTKEVQDVRLDGEKTAYHICCLPMRVATLLLASRVKHYTCYGSSRSSVPENRCSISTDENCS